MTMRKKKLCVTYTRRWMMNKCYVTKLHRETNVYLVVHAIHQYRRKIIYNEHRAKQAEREIRERLNLTRIKEKSVRTSIFGGLTRLLCPHVSQLRSWAFASLFGRCFHVHSRTHLRECTLLQNIRSCEKSSSLSKPCVRLCMRNIIDKL